MDLTSISYDELRKIYKQIGLEIQKRKIENKNYIENGSCVTSQLISKFFKNKKVVYNIGSINLLKNIMEEDWSKLFPITENIEKKYNVYLHCDPFTIKQVTNFKGILPLTGIPFYVGKGTDNRLQSFSRNNIHKEMFNSLINKGCKKEEILCVPFKNLMENEAFELESKLIFFFGLIIDNRRRNGVLVNLDKPKTPFEFIQSQ